MAKIKICGLRRSEDIAYTNELKPDYAGFVFAQSRRMVSREEALCLRKDLDPSIPAVGVFVNQDMEWIAGLIKDGIIQMAQLHGEESAEEIAYLKSVADCPVIKAVRLNTETASAIQTTIERAANLPADYLLLDSGAGSGKTFPWESIPKGLAKPYFLAGGIGFANAAQALTQTQAFALDASSSVETDGKKDYGKMKELIRRVHTYER